MPATARFYLEKIRSGNILYDGSEFHHMIRVARHQAGDTIRLFDGHGHEADAEIETVSRNSAQLNVGKVETMPFDVGPTIKLAVPIPKFSRAGWLVEKAVEFGVNELIPLATSRSIVDPRDSKIEGFKATVIAACKQSGRSRLMEIAQPTKFSVLTQNRFNNQLVVVAHPGGVPFRESFVKSILKEAASGPNGAPKSLLIVIGPEGGLTIEEVTQAVANGARLVGLGPRILRVESAALAMAAIVQTAIIP